MSTKYEQLEWFCRGAWENYSDIMTTPMICRYFASVNYDFIYSVISQKSSNKDDVDRTKHSDQQNVDQKIEGIGQSINLSVKPFSHKQLESATCIEELRFSDEIFRHIDHKQMVVGGDNTWSMDAAPHKEFRIRAKVYEYSFMIQPIK